MDLLLKAADLCCTRCHSVLILWKGTTADAAFASGALSYLCDMVIGAHRELYGEWVKSVLGILQCISDKLWRYNFVFILILSFELQRCG